VHILTFSCSPNKFHVTVLYCFRSTLRFSLLSTMLSYLCIIILHFLIKRRHHFKCIGEYAKLTSLSIVSNVKTAKLLQNTLHIDDADERGTLRRRVDSNYLICVSGSVHWYQLNLWERHPQTCGMGRRHTKNTTEHS
jgi:hypothetical protein